MVSEMSASSSPEKMDSPEDARKGVKRRISNYDDMSIQSYVAPTLGSFIIMGVCYWLGSYGHSLFWVIVLVALSWLKSYMWKKRQKRIMALQAAAVREREVVMAQFQDLPAWVNFPDTERVEWINKVILQLWPYIGEYAKKFLTEFVVPQVKTQMPSAFRSFKFTKMDMGDIPCRVGGIKVYTHNVGRDRIIMDMDVAYAGDCEFTVSVAGFSGGMNQLQFSGKLRAILKPLLPYPPMIGGVTAYFLETPKMDFNLTGMGEMVELPGLMTAIRSVINAQVSNICVLPNEIVVPLAPNVDVTKLFFPEPDGIIRLKIIEAKNLENRDIGFLKKGASDPYCEIQVGAQYFKTRTIDDNLNPVWNEHFEAVVDQADGQKLRFELFDEDTASSDEELGRLTLPLDMIKRSGVINKWYPLEGCKHGDFHVKVAWYNLTKELSDLERLNNESEWLHADKPIHPALLMVFIDNISDLPYPKAKLEPSPFVEVSIGKEKQKTPVKEKTVNPLFQSRFSFFVRHPEGQDLKIEAIDDGTRRTLGEMTLPLQTLLTEPNLEIYQRTFSLSQGVHQSPIVITVRLRAFAPGETIDTAKSGIDDSPQGRIYGNAIHIERASKGESEEEGKATILQNGAAAVEPGKSIPAESAVDATVPETKLNANQLQILRKNSGDSNLSSQSFRKRRGFSEKLFSSKHAMSKLANGDSFGKIQLGLRYAQQTSKLILNINRASELRPIDKSGSADPYVSVKLVALDGSQSAQKKRTGIVERCLEPQFENHFEFDVHSSDLHNYKILVRVKDATNYGIFVKPPTLGSVEIRLENFDVSQDLVNHWVHLENTSK